MRIAACDRTIAAPVDVVWRLLTTVDGLNRWMSVEAEVDLRVGGVIRWRHEEGHTVAGEIRDVVPMRRLVLTYGRTGFQLRLIEELPGCIGQAAFAGWCADRLTRLLPVHRWLVRHLT
jgi:hypothetical protein